MVGFMQLLVHLFYLDWSRSIEFATPGHKVDSPSSLRCKY
jgi:hypothetical protein